MSEKNRREDFCPICNMQVQLDQKVSVQRSRYEPDGRPVTFRQRAHAQCLFEHRAWLAIVTFAWALGPAKKPANGTNEQYCRLVAGDRYPMQRLIRDFREGLQFCLRSSISESGVAVIWDVSVKLADLLGTDELDFRMRPPKIDAAADGKAVAAAR